MINLISYEIIKDTIFLLFSEDESVDFYYRNQKLIKNNDGSYSCLYDIPSFSFSDILAKNLKGTSVTINLASDIEPLIGSLTILNPQKRGHLTRDTILSLAKNNVLFSSDLNLRAHSCVVMSYIALEKMDLDIISQCLDLCLHFYKFSDALSVEQNIKRNKYHLKASLLFVILLLSIATTNKDNLKWVKDEIYKHFDIINKEYKYKETIYNINRMLILLSCLEMKKGKSIERSLSLSILMTSISVSNYTVNSNPIIFGELTNAVGMLEKHKYLHDGKISIEECVLLSCRLVGKEPKNFFINRFAII